MNRERLRAALGTAALFIETRVYPLYYAYFAYKRTRTTWAHFDDARASALGLMHAHYFASARIHLLVLFVYAVRFTWVPFCLLTMFALLRRGPSARPPDRPSDVWIPLAGATVSSFSDFLINNFGNLHDLMDDELIPVSPTMIGMSYLLVLGGRVLSAAGIICLGRSFSIYIEERPLVRHGVYRWIKHPIYIGYTLSLIGVLFRNPSLAMTLYLLIAATFFAVRAALEEGRLKAAYPEYGVAPDASA